MSVVACPKCAEKVTLPPKTPPAAKVRCPLCAEDYLLSEAMSTLPPMLEVLELPEGYRPASDEIDISTAAFLSSADRPARMDDDGGELKLEEPGGGVATLEEVATPRYDEWGPTSSTASLQEVSPATPTRELLQTPARKKKKQINPLIHIVGIVMGGVVAIPAALLILLWLPKPLHRDPMKLGPWLGKNAPYLAPSKFWDVKSETVKDDSTTKPETNAASVANKKPITQGSSNGGLGGDQVEEGAKSGLSGNQFEEALKNPNVSFGPDNKNPAKKPNKVAPKVKDPVEPEPIIDDTEPEPKPAPEIDLKPLRDPEPKPKPEPKPEPGEEPEIKFELPEPSPPEPVVDPLATQREVLAAANKAFDEAVATADKKAAALDLYRAAAHLAEKLPGDTQGTAGLDLLFADPKKLQFFGIYSAGWQDNQDRDTPGIVLSGTVKDCKPAGERFEVRVVLPSRDKRELLLITAKECQPGEKLFVAGRFVMNAKDMVSGYVGEATMAVDARVLHVVGK